MAQESEENLKKAKLNSIKQIRLVRLLRKNYFGNCTIKLRNSNKDVTYEAVTDTNGSSYIVNLDQVYDIVEEEEWIHGKFNCISNIGSSQMVTLSWGAKKKELINQSSVLFDEGLQVGNHVVVENHGKYWPHEAEIVDIDMENNTVWIRWETTQKLDSVDLGALIQFSLEDALPRKQKGQTKTHRFL
jgi:hypothetical protein